MLSGCVGSAMVALSQSVLLPLVNDHLRCAASEVATSPIRSFDRKWIVSVSPTTPLASTMSFGLYATSHTRWSGFFDPSGISKAAVGDAQARSGTRMTAAFLMVGGSHWGLQAAGPRPGSRSQRCATG